MAIWRLLFLVEKSSWSLSVLPKAVISSVYRLNARRLDPVKVSRARASVSVVRLQLQQPVSLTRRPLLVPRLRRHWSRADAGARGGV